MRTTALLIGLLLLPLWADPAHARITREVPQSSQEVRLSFAPVVERAAPAVVSITTSKRVARRDPFFDDPFFRYFFRDFGGPELVPRERPQNALGSGVIVRGDGIIVTNHHVVADADEITVVLDDRRELEARLLGSDEVSDLAFLKVDVEGARLPSLALGHSDSLAVGDLVLAIGNPFGIGQTVTSGIVSATARTAPGVSEGVSFIQTDAAINPGNSGGALVALDGTLVGINTAIFTRGGGSIGIGFAIPADLVRARLTSLDGEGRIARSWLGAELQEVTAELAEALGLDRPRGVVVRRVHERAAAARAGLLTGDVLLSVDGAEVHDPAGVNLRLSLRALGEQAQLKVWRAGSIREVAVDVESAPLRPPPERTVLDGPHPLEGAVVANMSPGFNEELGLDMFETGVVVLGVQRGGFATRLRLEPGDRIAAVQGRAVEDVGTLLRELRRDARIWRLAIERDGRLFELQVS